MLGLLNGQEEMLILPLNSQCKIKGFFRIISETPFFKLHTPMECGASVHHTSLSDALSASDAFTVF